MRIFLETRLPNFHGFYKSVSLETYEKLHLEMFRFKLLEAKAVMKVNHEFLPS